MIVKASSTRAIWLWIAFAGSGTTLGTAFEARKKVDWALIIAQRVLKAITKDFAMVSKHSGRLWLMVQNYTQCSLDLAGKMVGFNYYYQPEDVRPATVQSYYK